MNASRSDVLRIGADARVDSAARVGAALSGSTYAVPRRFLWLADLVVQLIAVVVAHELTPAVRDLLMVAAGSTGWLAWLSPNPAELLPWGRFMWLALVSTPVTLLMMQVLGGYSDPLHEQSRTRILVTSVLAPFVGLSFVTVVLIAVRAEHVSRVFVFSNALFTAAGFVGYRGAIRLYKQRRLRAGFYARHVLLIAPPATRDWLAAHFAEHLPPNLWRVYGYLDPPGESVREVARAAGEGASARIERLGKVSDLAALLVHRPIHRVVLVQSPGGDAWMHEVIEWCEFFQVPVHLVPEALLSSPARRMQAIFRGPLRLPEIVISPSRLDSDALFVKRVLDIVVSATLLVLLAPLFALIAVAIKLTTPDLPVFYRWRVVGYKGRTFTGYKFTTMTSDADARKAELQHLNEMTGPVFKITRDPRVTPLGKILRKFSLNELPQLWSVLKGDMSLVGPRPAYPNELERYDLWHKRKLCVQPGITCLWQVRGRHRITDFDEWVRMDFEYIDTWSLWKDFVILVRTVWIVIAGTGA